MDREEYAVQTKEMMKFVMEQIFNTVSGKEVEMVADIGFMAVMKPAEAENAIVMMGELQELLLRQFKAMVEGLHASEIPPLQEFCLEIAAFATQNNSEIICELMDNLSGKPKPNETVQVSPTVTH